MYIEWGFVKLIQYIGYNEGQHQCILRNHTCLSPVEWVKLKYHSAWDIIFSISSVTSLIAEDKHIILYYFSSKRHLLNSLIFFS